MDKDKLKLIVRNLELLVDSLKAEVYSDVAAYQKYTEPEVRNRPMLDYDEVFDDDGYTDQSKETCKTARKIGQPRPPLYA